MTEKHCIGIFLSYIYFKILFFNFEPKGLNLRDLDGETPSILQHCKFLQFSMRFEGAKIAFFPALPIPCILSEKKFLFVQCIKLGYTWLEVLKKAQTTQTCVVLTTSSV